jgi:hypothetical protein
LIDLLTFFAFIMIHPSFPASAKVVIEGCGELVEAMQQKKGGSGGSSSGAGDDSSGEVVSEAKKRKMELLAKMKWAKK